jgi:hypothetical protein
MSIFCPVPVIAQFVLGLLLTEGPLALADDPKD